MRALIGDIHYGDRGAEWLLSSAMLGLSVVLTLPGNSLSIPAYRFFDSFAFGDIGWCAIFGVVGGVSLSVLWWNGRSPRSAVYRRACSATRFMIWGQLFASLVGVSIFGPRPVAPGAGIYGTFLLFELISFYRAVRDVRYRR